MDEPDDRSRLSAALKRAFSRVLAPPCASRDVPMSFSADLLAAILAGRKTETRRPMRPQPVGGDLGAPPAAAGDRLAIREAWCRAPGGGFAFQRDGALPPGVARWTPSRFMPRGATRLFLRVTGVDAARLAAIDEAAAVAEGFARSPLGNVSARDAFLAAWDTFYGDTPFAAAADSWVWVIRFEPPWGAGPKMTIVNRMDPRVAIVGDSVSARFGGEAVLPLHYFRRLVGRGVDAYLICHVRTRGELTELLGPAIERVRFVEQTKFDVAVWRLGDGLPRQLRLMLRAVSAFGAQRRGREIARELIRTRGVNLVHQPAPVSPKQPTLVGGLGVPVIIGPMNGGMVYPPAFRGMESRAERAAVRGGRMMAGVMNRIASGKRNAAALLVANRRTADALPPGVGGVPVIELVENGVDLKLFDRVERAADPSRATRFLFVGRLEPWKGVELLLRAWPSVVAATPASLSIVGDGVDLPRLRAIAAELKIGPEVEFAGFVPQPEVAARMRDSDVFVLPSLFECGGAVVLEAMARSMPAIALRWGGPADYLDAETGVLIDAGGRDDIVRDLSRAMIDLALDPARRAAMGAAGRAKVEREYDWERKVDRMMEIYRAALSGNVRAAAS